MRCPLCGGASRRRFDKQGIWIRDCDACGHRFAELTPDPDHVARVYGDDYFAGGGAGYAGYLAEGNLLRERGRWYARLLEGRGVERGAVLDVGCAAGFFLQGLVDCGWKGTGVEPNAAMAEHARRLGLAVRTGTLEQLDTEERFDLVSLIQVVAHFTDVRRALGAAVARMRPGGSLLVETWNRESWTARVLGSHWHEYSPPSVLHWFSPAGLTSLLAEMGLEERGRGRPRRWIGAGHAKSLLRHKAAESALAAVLAGVLRGIPDRVALPYPADDLFWALYRRST